MRITLLFYVNVQILSASFSDKVFGTTIYAQNVIIGRVRKNWKHTEKRNAAVIVMAGGGTCARCVKEMEECITVTATAATLSAHTLDAAVEQCIALLHAVVREKLREFLQH